MEACRRLKEEFPDCWINTHISENPSEIRQAKQEFPDCSDYTAVHEKHGLLGPKFTAGHGVWLSNDEFGRFSKAGAAVCFCPLSNLFLGSGLFRLGKAMDPDQPVRVCLGTDVGAGNAFSMIRVMEEAYKVGLCNNITLDGSINPREQDLEESKRNKLSTYRAFCLATLGGAKALYLDGTIGNFAVGKEADFVALDLKTGQHALAWHQELTYDQGMPTTVQQAAELLVGLLACGDDRNVAETWAPGKRAYQCEARAQSMTE
jgi:guanine deaminase